MDFRNFYVFDSNCPIYFYFGISSLNDSNFLIRILTYHFNGDLNYSLEKNFKQISYLMKSFRFCLSVDLQNTPKIDK
jgi:hypothetical protein